MGVGAASSWGKVCRLLNNCHCGGGDDDYHKRHYHHDHYNLLQVEKQLLVLEQLLWLIFITIVIIIYATMSSSSFIIHQNNLTQVEKQLLGQLPRPTPPALARFASRRNEVTLMKILMMVIVMWLLSIRNSVRLYEAHLGDRSSKEEKDKRGKSRTLHDGDVGDQLLGRGAEQDFDQSHLREGFCTHGTPVLILYEDVTSAFSIIGFFPLTNMPYWQVMLTSSFERLKKPFMSWVEPSNKTVAQARKGIFFIKKSWWNFSCNPISTKNWKCGAYDIHEWRFDHIYLSHMDEVHIRESHHCVPYDTATHTIFEMSKDTNHPLLDPKEKRFFICSGCPLSKCDICSSKRGVQRTLSSIYISPL